MALTAGELYKISVFSNPEERTAQPLEDFRRSGAQEPINRVVAGGARARRRWWR